MSLVSMGAPSAAVDEESGFIPGRVKRLAGGGPCGCMGVTQASLTGTAASEAVELPLGADAVMSALPAASTASMLTGGNFRRPPSRGAGGAVRAPIGGVGASTSSKGS